MGHGTSLLSVSFEGHRMGVGEQEHRGGLNEAMLAGGDPAGPFADRNQPCDASTPIFTRP